MFEYIFFYITHCPGLFMFHVRCFTRGQNRPCFTPAIWAQNSWVNSCVSNDNNKGSVPFRSKSVTREKLDATKWNLTPIFFYRQFLVNMASMAKVYWRVKGTRRHCTRSTLMTCSYSAKQKWTLCQFLFLKSKRNKQRKNKIACLCSELRNPHVKNSASAVSVPCHHSEV